MNLGTFGVWTSFRHIGEDSAGEAAALAEELGYGTFWLGGSPRLTQVRALLEATERLIVATGIVNVWAYEPADLTREYEALAADFPGRLLVGIGIGHPEATSDYKHPLKTMREFLAGCDIPREALCIAALGPKMLDLSAAQTLGTHPYFVTSEHTRFARERVGDGVLVAPEVACVVDDATDSARVAARDYAKLYLGLQNYTGNLKLFGFTDADIADGGSDRLIDEVVPHGTAEDIAKSVQQHLDAGADHVCLQPVGTHGVPADEWRALAGALGLG